MKARLHSHCVAVSRAMLSALFLVMVHAVTVFALDPTLEINQYAHMSWKIRDGFPKGQIGAFAQTRDGYLWLGSDLALFRFDGLRSTDWGSPTGEQLPSNFIRTLLAGRDGRLWIGT